MIGRLPNNAFYVIVKRFLAYAFKDVPSYEFLTPQERAHCTAEEFAALREWCLGMPGKEESSEVHAACPKCGPDTVSTNTHTYPHGVCNVCHHWVDLEAGIVDGPVTGPLP